MDAKSRHASGRVDNIKGNKPDGVRWTIENRHLEFSNPKDILDGAEDKRTDPLYADKIGYIPFAYHLVPRRGLAKVAAVMRSGERKGRRDFEWMDVPVEEHINHCISHLIAYMAKKKGGHLANAVCRALMALDLDEAEDLPSPVFDPGDAPDRRNDWSGCHWSQKVPSEPSP